MLYDLHFLLSQGSHSSAKLRQIDFLQTQAKFTQFLKSLGNLKFCQKTWAVEWCQVSFQLKWWRKNRDMDDKFAARYAWRLIYFEIYCVHTMEIW